MATPKKCEIVLLRHAHSTANLKGVLAGRDNTVGLSPRGEAEAQQVAQVLAQGKFDAIYVSDLKRCKQTIAPLLKTTGARPVASKEILEMDYGTWSGKPLSKLAKMPLWADIQSRPSTVRFPSGESFAEMSLRANQAVLEMAKGKSRILVVSHGDVIKSIVAYHLGLPLDNFQRIAIDPASLTTISYSPSHLISLNNVEHLQRHSESPKSPKSPKSAKSPKSNQRDIHSLGGGAGRV